MTIKNKIHLIALIRSIAGSAGGIAVIILCILGLVHISSYVMVSVATLTIGTTLLFKGLAISIEYPTFFNQLFGSAIDQNELIDGIAIELLAAVASIILGCAALFGTNTDTMVAIAVIINGAAFVIDSSAINRLNSLKLSVVAANPVTQKIIEEKVSAAMAVPVLIGISSIVMGILSLVGYVPLTLNLIALMSIAICSLFMGAAITGRMLNILQIIKTTHINAQSIKIESTSEHVS